MSITNETDGLAGLIAQWLQKYEGWYREGQPYAETRDLLHEIVGDLHELEAALIRLRGAQREETKDEDVSR